MPFTCTICEEESTRICVACTKDTCGNHLCDKCKRCSDCCDCEVHLDASEEEILVTDAVHHADAEDDLDAGPVEVGELADGPREPEPHPHPTPDPDPAPEPDPLPIPGFPGPEHSN
jgi:hypothetical protein